jgi:hypothetical protein
MTPLWFWQTDHGISVSVLKPKRFRDWDHDPSGRLKARSRENAKDAALSEIERAKIADYRRDHKKFRNNAKKIAEHFAEEFARGKRALRRKIGKLIRP